MSEKAAATGLCSIRRITRRVFWIGGGAHDDGAMRAVSECVGAIEPLTTQVRRAKGGWPLVCALTAIAVDLAVRNGDAGLAATLFENTAHLLQHEAQSGLGRPHDARDA